MRITDYYVASDAMGSVTTILDEDGNILERRSYDAFGDMTCMLPNGTPVANSPTGVDVGFQGQIRDEVSGFYQMGYRWHSPVLGRWLSQDPVGLAGGVNLDAFTVNSPTTHTDPYGLDIWIEGPSADEPNAHQSINVGNPLGNYYSQSFGTDGFVIWNAGIYVDVNTGGEIEKYTKTTPEQDTEFRKHLQEDYHKDERKWYGATTCRTYSQDEFEKAKKKYNCKECTPPKRVPASRSFFRRIFSSSNSSSTSSSASGTGSSR